MWVCTANSNANSIQVRTDINGISNQGGVFTDRCGRSENAYYDSGFLENTGSSNAHNNMPPYLTINVWKRIA